MSECIIYNEWDVESKLKFSQSYLTLFQLQFSKKKSNNLHPDSVIETDSVNQADSFKKYHPLV